MKMLSFKSLNRFLPYVLLLAFSIFAILPFFSPGYFVIHDNTQVQRTFEMAKSLGDWVFPVRWVADLGYGYGYPIFNYYAPAFYYVSGSLTVLGATALWSTKISAMLAILLSAFSMYFLAREIWGKWGGILSAMLYTYAPFHAADIYVRGAFGESLAFALLPLPFLGLYKVYSENSKKVWYWIGFTSLSFALLILSHNLSSFMTAPFLLFFSVIVSYAYFKKNGRFSMHFFYSLVLGILISAFYWVPALVELKFADVYSITRNEFDLREHFVCLRQLWYSPWGFGGSAPGCLDGISFGLGKLHILLALIASVGLFFIRKNNMQFFGLLLSLSVFVLSIFLMTGYSKFIWELLPPMEFFQFPWRFLLLSVFSISFAGGFLLWFLERKITQRLALIICLLLLGGLVFYYQKLFYPQGITTDPSENYTNEYSLKWFTSKISDEYMPKNFPTPVNEEDIVRSKVKIEGDGEIRYKLESSSKIEAIVRLYSDSKVYINIANFPAWNFYLDGKKIIPEQAFGIYSLNVSEGDHKIEAKFIQTPIEKLSNLLSLGGLAALLAGIIFKHRKIYEK